ncbi:unnamed protein product [Meganyctiphanes norvegica]|uniref:Activating signal cointegrator 1 n=1 Tax=Meganyctiphanes norvegica TaxID=48144 RepID=A0AAV2PLE0_MEGNR
MLSLENWACRELDNLGLPDPEIIVRYLEPLENSGEVREYLESMLDKSKTDHRKFIEEFVNRQEAAKNSVDSRFYRKPDFEDIGGIKVQGSNNDNKKNKQKTTKDGGKGVNDVPVSSKKTLNEDAKKKNKFVSLYTDEGANRDVVMLSGRHKCECQASKHGLVNNCMSCGRIVCDQEGAGPCSFCGTLVVSRDQKEVLSRGSRKSEQLQKKLFSDKNAVVNESSGKLVISESLQKAIDHKNKLLEFDKTSEKRTKVYDDESDYFSTNSKWLSESDREKLQKREEELRKKRFERGAQKITLDFAGRKVMDAEEQENVYDPEDPIIKDILEGKSNDIYTAFEEVDPESYNAIQLTRPVFVNQDDKGTVKSSNKNHVFRWDDVRHRLQDAELQIMSDDGMCLSMHQPWASLLVCGIKMHEGRQWYSSHRGRLWIASAAKIPTAEEIQTLEQHYQAFFQGQDLKFPKDYSTGCLLGCVDVDDVLPQEEYRQKYPDGDSDSPYVFICTNPQEMLFKFPLKGQHKIYKLDSKIHQAAKKQLFGR